MAQVNSAIHWPDIDEEFGLAGMLGISESLLEDSSFWKIVEPPLDR